jgi:hypothetical protein
VTDAAKEKVADATEKVAEATDVAKEKVADATEAAKKATTRRSTKPAEPVIDGPTEGEASI